MFGEQKSETKTRNLHKRSFKMVEGFIQKLEEDRKRKKIIIVWAVYITCQHSGKHLPNKFGHDSLYYQLKIVFTKTLFFSS